MRARSGLRFNDSLHLNPALLALENADFQTFAKRMRRASNQVRIAAALVTANRRDKFLIRRKYGMLFHTPPACLQREGGACLPPQSTLRTPPSLPGKVTWSARKMARKGPIPLAFAH
jgi:hypothetical protein